MENNKIYFKFKWGTSYGFLNINSSKIKEILFTEDNRALILYGDNTPIEIDDSEDVKRLFDLMESLSK